MLVVVHYRNIKFFLEATLYLKALGCLDILEVDTTESGGNGLYCLDELLGILLVDLDVKDINAGIDLEKQSFTLHNGLAGERAYVA